MTTTQPLSVKLCNFSDLTTPAEQRGSIAVYRQAVGVKPRAKAKKALLSVHTEQHLSPTQRLLQVTELSFLHDPTWLKKVDEIKYVQQHLLPVCGLSKNQAIVLNPYKTLLKKFNHPAVMFDWKPKGRQLPIRTYLLCTPQSVMIIDDALSNPTIHLCAPDTWNISSSGMFFMNAYLQFLESERGIVQQPTTLGESL